jgi:DNA-binding XRE family transcriptional regulator
MDALPFGDLHIEVVRRPYPYRWKCTQVVPRKPRTIGDHIKRRRLELHLFQSDVAKQLGVDIASVQNWEHNAYQPVKRFLPRLINWLGYVPVVGTGSNSTAP